MRQSVKIFIKKIIYLHTKIYDKIFYHKKLRRKAGLVLMGKYFGTDGFRGEANKALTAQKAFKVGRYIGWYYGQQHEDGRARIIIGKDTRRSSYMLEAALTAGITSSGSDAYLLHVTTTPSVSYCCRTDGFDCGIMISASHNPFYDNGIKIMRANGQKIEAEIEEKIEAYIDGEIEEIPLAEREAIGNVVDYAAGRNRYIGYLMTIPTRAFNGMKIGLDCANGASWNIARSVFEALGAKVFIINNTPDGLNINKNCGSTHIDNLKKFVLDNGLNVGFAYDGDADRCLAVDELGNEVNGDQIMFLCGKYMKETGRLDGNTIVTTIMSNMGLYKACEAIGRQPESRSAVTTTMLMGCAVAETTGLYALVIAILLIFVAPGRFVDILLNAIK